ncbi:hypothetical protein IWZ01DRAFT_306990 [Phyllosticta capitalensis]
MTVKRFLKSATARQSHHACVRARSSWPAVFSILQGATPERACGISLPPPDSQKQDAARRHYSRDVGNGEILGGDGGPGQPRGDCARCSTQNRLPRPHWMATTGRQRQPLTIKTCLFCRKAQYGVESGRRRSFCPAASWFFCAETPQPAALEPPPRVRGRR